MDPDRTPGAPVPVEVELQDPPQLIPNMPAYWRDGADVVLARRVDRNADGLLKRGTAALFYRLHNRISNVTIPENVGDFRVMDKAVVDVLRTLPERQRFMKGLFAWVGSRTATIEYVRPPRALGTDQILRAEALGSRVEGIASFSIVPLKAWTYVGAAGALFTGSYALYIVLRTLIFGVDVPGYASLLVVVLFVGSLQLFSVGLLGEYIGRTYLESKQRPVYVVRRTITNRAS